MPKATGVPPGPLLTDGARIYFLEFGTAKGAALTIAQVSASGGDTVPVSTSLKLDGMSNITPDGSELFVNEFPEQPPDSFESALWSVPLPAGRPKRIGSIIGSDVTVSPDGTSLFYSTEKAVYTAQRDASNPRKLFDTAPEPFWLRLSPDGKTLLFSVWNRDRLGMSMWQSQSDGTGLTRLLPEWRGATDWCCANWTQDGRYFVFQAYRGTVASIWAVRVSGDLLHKVNHNPVLLTQGAAGAFSPLPSRDGKKVSFVGANPRAELMRYEPKTHSFQAYLGGLSVESLSISPDARHVAYVSSPDESLYVANDDGSDRNQLTVQPMYPIALQWSPDGSQIAFMARVPGRHWSIYRVSVDGGALEQLVSGDLDYAEPTWSPDGKSLAFGEYVRTLDRTTRNQIHVLDLAKRQVVDVPESSHLSAPQWSPDGHWLAAVRTDSRQPVLYNWSTHEWQPLVTRSARFLNWSPDSKCLIFVDPSAKKLPVYRVCLRDRKLLYIADLTTAGNLMFGQVSWWMGIGPDGSILTARDISTEEIYALDVKFP